MYDERVLPAFSTYPCTVYVCFPERTNRMKNTLSITRNSLFKRLYLKGKSASNSELAIYIQRSTAPTNRLGITVSTKLGNAVIRNRIKRRIKEAYRKIEHLLPGCYNIVIVARFGAINKKSTELEYTIIKLLKKTDIMVNEL